MATYADYKAGKVLRLTADYGEHKKGSLWRRYPEKDDGSSAPGFIRAEHTGPVQFPDWEYITLTALEVAPDQPRRSSNAAGELAKLRCEVQKVLDTLPEFGPAFQATLLEAVAAECQRVAGLLRQG